MAPSIQLSILIISILLTSFCFSRTTADGGHHSFTKPAAPTPPATSTPFVAPTTLLVEILTNLGFNELSIAVRSLSNDSVLTTNLNGPFTLFAPTDASIRSCSTCPYCFITSLLRQHIVPGLYSHDYLRIPFFASKIETMDTGRCITMSSDAYNNSKIYVSGVEITHPDLFNNGIVVVHGLQRHIAPLSPFSCINNQQSNSHATMRLMLSNAMIRLGNNGFSALALAFKLKYAELVNLQNMTVFAVDDVSIYSGGSHSYVGNIRFHIVPNYYLSISDLENLPVGTFLRTLAPGQLLAITTAAGLSPMRINYVRIKLPEVLRNSKIVVHCVYLPFPHLHHSVSASASMTTSYDDEINSGESGDASSSFEDRAAENNDVNVTVNVQLLQYFTNKVTVPLVLEVALLVLLKMLIINQWRVSHGRPWWTYNHLLANCVVI